VQHGAVFRAVDVLPRKHGVNLGLQLGGIRKLHQLLLS
jgi:hypothetical protein